MGKLIFCVSCFCDTLEKEKVLLDNIEFIHKQGHEVALISPIPVSEIIQTASDYTFITKENVKTDWPGRCYAMWWSIKGVTMTTTQPYYGWNNMLHIKNLGTLMMNQGYKEFVFMIYDTLFNETHLQEIYDAKQTLVFPSKKDGEINRKHSIHLFYTDKEYFQNMLSLIDENVFYSRNDWGISKYISETMFKPLGFNTSKTPVEDQIYFFDQSKLFNHSPVDGIRFFIGSEYQSSESVKMFVYEGNEECNIECNGLMVEEKDGVIDLKLLKKDIVSLTLKTQKEIVDLLPTLNSLNHTKIE